MEKVDIGSKDSVLMNRPCASSPRPSIPCSEYPPPPPGPVSGSDTHDNNLIGIRYEFRQTFECSRKTIFEMCWNYITMSLLFEVSAENNDKWVGGLVYVVDRSQGSCGVCDIPEVLRGGAE